MKRLFSTEAISKDAWLALRLFSGFALMHHGIEVFNTSEMKGFADYLANDLLLPASTLLAYLCKGTEFFGGILLALGLATRWVSLVQLINMLVAGLMAHSFDIFGKGEHAMLFAFISVGFGLAGAGRISLDTYFHKQSA